MKLGLTIVRASDCVDFTYIYLFIYLGPVAKIALPGVACASNV